MKVVPIPQTNLMDVAAMLRRLADEVENSDFDHAIVVLTKDNGELDVRGYGKVGDTAREVGILQMAILELWQSWN